MGKHEEKDRLMREANEALAMMIIANASGSSTKKYEKSVRSAIEGYKKLGEDWAARFFERKLEERLREARK